MYNISSWLSNRVVDVAYTRSDRICSRYEDDSKRHSAHIARSSRATRCSHSLLVGRRFCGKLDWEAPTQGHIYYHFASGHYTYEPDLCVLRRLGRDEAQACMADVGPVLFAGDSVTRYQYLTFIHFLASGKYQHAFNGSKSLSNAHTHVAASRDEKYFKLWQHAEDQIGRHRQDSHLFFNTRWSQGLEHAHLTLPLHADASREAHVYYYYVEMFSSQLKEAIKWAMTKRQDWRYLIFNVCAHYGMTSIKKMGGQVIKAFQWAHETYKEEFTRAGTQLVWKGCTTPSMPFRARTDAEEAKIAEYAASAGVAIYDLRTVVKAAFAQHLITSWDDETVHYLEFMYEQWNDLLLNILCPAGPEAEDDVGAAPMPSE